MLQPQAQAGMPGQQDGNSATSGVQQRPRASNAGLQNYGPYRQRKRIILCFDGTGNKFTGTSSDSNILKLFRMLDRDNGDKHYYQPGIGTYVNSRSLSHTSRLARLNSWYQKAKDSAVGTSFDEHVMGAYRFLMQWYDDDDIFIFGFSRGAYVARFLAEMLDHVGLLSAGNQEMSRFAWKAFANWQQREDNTKEEKKKKQEMLTYLQAFRDTFSRPVRRIRFLGLFDTVNSVPRFENAWMKRSKFPYTARSSAKVIRHAVAIDERRAKFRSDLLSGAKSSHPHADAAHHGTNGKRSSTNNWMVNGEKPNPTTVDRFRRRSAFRPRREDNRTFSPQMSTVEEDRLDPRRGTLGAQARMRSSSPSGSQFADDASMASSYINATHADDDEQDETEPQDIEELWFPGGHADLGGGWPLANGEESPLSHGPLVWMVREAQRAGLEFDGEAMLELNCCDEDYNISALGLPSSSTPAANDNLPEIEVTSSPNSSPVDLFHTPHSEKREPGWATGMEPTKRQSSKFHDTLHSAFTKGVLHDCLEFNSGLPHTSVVSWKLMEYLPFRRMDLRPDGTWKAITFPLPMGEVRDIPEDAWIHNSAIRRMEANPNYRPGNLIIGGGGRGVRKAPKKYGIGNWRVLKEEGDPVGMVYIRDGESVTKQRDKAEHDAKIDQELDKHDVEKHQNLQDTVADSEKREKEEKAFQKRTPAKEKALAAQMISGGGGGGEKKEKINPYQQKS